MTKKEKEAFDAAIQRANIYASLHWTEPVAKDLPVPKWREKTSGWDYNVYNGTVRPMWSESAFHGDGQTRGDWRTGSQDGVALFSTRLLALRALRHAVELESAHKLLKIDEAITEELSCLHGQKDNIQI